MSSAQQPAGQAGSPGQAGPAGSPGPTVTGGVTRKPDLYRSPLALVVWWVWAAFALANLVDLAVQGRSHFALDVAAVLILITGVTYVAAFRPRVIADDAGIMIRNPIRDHQIPWDCVQSVDLGDSLQVHCARPDDSQRSKTLYAWAVHSPRRSRLKAEARARRSDRVNARRSDSYSRLPPEARQAMTMTDAEHTARTLEERANKARAAGATGGRLTATWSWAAIAALLVPVVLLIVVLLA